MTPKHRRWGLSALLAVLLLLVNVQFAHAEPAALEASVSAQDGNIVVEGTVTNGGQPVRNARVYVQANSETVYYIDADNNGAFAVYIPAPGTSGQAHVKVWFEGRGNVEAVSRTYTVNLGGSIAVEPTTDETADEAEEETTAPPADSPVTIEASVEEGTIRSGSLIAASGTVSAPAGAVVGMQVDARFGDTALEDSTTFTDDAGRFTTFVEIPQDAAAGDSTITFTTPAGSGFEAGSIDVAIQIAEPMATEPTQVLESASASAPEDGDEAEAEMQTQAEEADESALPGTPANQPHSLRWVVAVVIIIGGLAVLMTAAILYRSLQDRRRHRERALDDLFMDGDELPFEEESSFEEDLPLEEPEVKPRRGI